MALLALLVSFVLAPSTSRAQVPRTAVVPSPAAVLGFAPGDDRTIADWRQITNYFSRLDRASDRVLVQNLGATTLQRQLIAAFISAPENIRDLAKYKNIQARLADPRKIMTVQERDQLIAEGKTVVVISCSIHSTEIVASQMSMQLAYEMATATDPDTVEILRNTILILLPAANPDGIDIVANWYRKTLGTRSEGTEPPELYHHYAGHDDNRDWFMLNLKETKILTRLLWKEWFPQIVYDVHQQGANGSRFFIPPFYDPPNPHIPPLLLREVGVMGHKIAADLQAAGFKGVVTNAAYDTWWHGGFRTAPYYHNSIGILSEAASARLMSPTTVTREQLTRTTTRGLSSALPSSPQTNFPDPWPGGVWRPRDIMALELSASRSVLSLAAKYREGYLRNFYELGRAAAYAEPAAGLPLGYVIHAGQGRDENVARMIGALVEQGVEVFRLEREIHATLGEQLIRRPGSTNGSKVAGTATGIGIRPVEHHPEVPLGSYIIFLNQPYRQNVLALFEPQVYPTRLTATGEAERPYDVAGWTLPMQMGVESLAVMSIRESVNERRLTLIKSENDVRRDLGLPLSTGDKSPIVNPVTSEVRVGIYQGARGNMDEGWTRYVFDTFNVPFKTVRDADLREAGLKSRFDVIVLPSERRRADADATEEAAPGGLNAATMESLGNFVHEGGTLICFDGSCGPTIKQLKLPLRNVLEGLRSSEFYCPGSVLRIAVDNSHPMARTMAKEVDAYFAHSSAFAADDSTQVRVIARYAKQEVLRSGWLLGEEKIKDKIALAEVSVGKGRVVLFGFRPQHRGQTWGTFPFIWNALTASK